MLESLLEAGGEIHGSENARWTPLWSAVNEAMPRLVQRCIEAGAGLKVGEGDPLPVFVVTRVLKRKLREADMVLVAERLREAGADLTAPGADGTTAFELARDSGLKRLAKVLKP